MSVEDQVKFIRSGMNVRRYHQHPTLETDTVGKHSCGVALFVNLIDPSARKQVLLHALYHDLGEWVLGDIPAPTKRLLSPAAKDEIDRIEDEALATHGFYGGELDKSEYHLLKLCDYLDGLAFCIEETNRGNVSMAPIRDKYLDYLYGLFAQEGALDFPWRTQARLVFNAILKGA